MEYQEWIDKLYADSKTASGSCSIATSQMVKVFPELQRVRGHYMCPAHGERPHWWCKDSLGKIVDPTARQFPSNGHGEYVELDESQPEPTGKCPECGEYCYEGGGGFCCPDHERSYMKYINDGLL